MNKFFDGEFWTFGIDVLKYMDADQEDRMDPMIYIFPRMTKCTFYKYGVSGEVSHRCAVIDTLSDAYSHRFDSFRRSNDTTPYAYCRWTWSTRKSTYACGSGSSFWPYSQRWRSSIDWSSLHRHGCECICWGCDFGECVWIFFSLKYGGEFLEHFTWAFWSLFTESIMKRSLILNRMCSPRFLTVKLNEFSIRANNFIL